MKKYKTGFMALLLLGLSTGAVFADEPVIFANVAAPATVPGAEIDEILQISPISDTQKKEIDNFINQALIDAAHKQQAQFSAEKNSESVSSSPNESEMITYAKSLLGVPYVYGGSSAEGFDCSGFVKYVFDKFNIQIPRTTFDQMKLGKRVDLGNITQNDLIFFDTRSAQTISKKEAKPDKAFIFEDIVIDENDTIDSKKEKPVVATHVGIYIGNGKFIHASSYNRKIVIEDLNSAYFKGRIVDIKRLV